MSWTDAELETVKTYWAAGETASQIAQRLQGRTRNAVIGKVHRSGYQRDGDVDMKAVAERRVKARRRDGVRVPRMDYVQRSADAEPLFPEFMELHDCPLGAAAGVRSLDETQCKFPIGDPRHGDFHFCGGTQKAGSVYCVYHHSVAFLPRGVREPVLTQYPPIKSGLRFQRGFT